MNTYTLTSETRELTGKGAARRIRAGGMIPAVLYGREEETVSLAVNEIELRRLLSSKWETAIVDLKISGKVDKECNAIVKRVQQHPRSGRVIHVDFQYVHSGERIRLTVPVHVVGNPRGVKEMGGILEHGVRELTIRCLPRDIPESIEIDVSELGIHESIHVKDIVERYTELEFLDDGESTLANVLPPKIEAEVTEEEELEEGAEEPEVITKGKEAKEGEKEEETKEED